MANVLILGATSAIAIEVAKLFGNSQNKLFLVARNGEKLKAVQQDLEVRGGIIAAAELQDLSDCSLHSHLVDKVYQQWKQVDVALIAHGSLGDQKACEKDFQLAQKEMIGADKATTCMEQLREA